MPYKSWELAAIDRAGYNGIRWEHIDSVAAEILRSGLAEVSRTDFDRACHRCGVDPDQFTQEDLDRLQERLNV